MSEKTYPLRTVERPEDVVPGHTYAHDTIVKSFGLRTIKAMTQGEQSLLRSKVGKSSPVKFLAVFDGRVFTFRVTVAKEIKNVDKVDFEKIPSITKENALKQFRKLNLTA